MAFVVAAIWTAEEGQAEVVLDVIEKMTPLSRQEPDCLHYQAHRSPENPNVFFLYEQYKDADAYEVHMATPHFEEYVKGIAIPRLESRSRSFYETLDL
jgi:quinol monooxygenase YgiN